MNEPALTRKAFEIADNCMLELLESHTIKSTETATGVARYLVVNLDSRPVSQMAAADPAIADAFGWLAQRGMACLMPVDSLLWIDVSPALG